MAVLVESIILYSLNLMQNYKEVIQLYMCNIRHDNNSGQMSFLGMSSPAFRLREDFVNT